LIFLALSIFLMYQATKKISLDKLLKDLIDAKYEWVILSLVFAFVAFVSRAYRWKLLIRPLGYNPSLFNTYNALMIGYTANFAFPRLGEVVRCGSLNRSNKIPLDKLIGTVIIERAVDILSLLILLITLMVVNSDLFGQFFQERLFEPLFGKIDNVFSKSIFFWIILASIILIAYILLFLFRKQLNRINLVIKLRIMMKGVISGLKTVFHMKNKWEFALHTLIIWACYFFMTYVVFFALPATSGLNIFAGVFVLVVGGLGMSAPVQGGIGAFHLIVTKGLTIYNIPEEDGFSFATLVHESQSFFAILLGIGAFISFIVIKRMHSKKSETKNTAN
jgi:glycosyltransferase 2 family protein